MNGSTYGFTVGQRLRSARAKTGRSLADLAAAAGMAEATLSRLERGLIPVRLDQVEAIAQALGMRAQTIFCEDVPKRLRNESPTVRIRPPIKRGPKGR